MDFFNRLFSKDKDQLTEQPANSAAAPAHSRPPHPAGPKPKKGCYGENCVHFNCNEHAVPLCPYVRKGLCEGLNAASAACAFRHVNVFSACYKNTLRSACDISGSRFCHYIHQDDPYFKKKRSAEHSHHKAKTASMGARNKPASAPEHSNQEQGQVLAFVNPSSTGATKGSTTIAPGRRTPPMNPHEPAKNGAAGKDPAPALGVRVRVDRVSTMADRGESPLATVMALIFLGSVILGTLLLGQRV